MVQQDCTDCKKNEDDLRDELLEISKDIMAEFDRLLTDLPYLYG